MYICYGWRAYCCCAVIVIVYSTYASPRPVLDIFAMNCSNCSNRMCVCIRAQWKQSIIAACQKDLGRVPVHCGLKSHNAECKHMTKSQTEVSVMHGQTFVVHLILRHWLVVNNKYQAWIEASIPCKSPIPFWYFALATQLSTSWITSQSAINLMMSQIATMITYATIHLIRVNASEIAFSSKK